MQSGCVRALPRQKAPKPCRHRYLQESRKVTRSSAKHISTEKIARVQNRRRKSWSHLLGDLPAEAQQISTGCGNHGDCYCPSPSADSCLGEKENTEDGKNLQAENSTGDTGSWILFWLLHYRNGLWGRVSAISCVWTSTKISRILLQCLAIFF